MAQKVFAGITLRSERAVHFGTLVRIHGPLAGVTTDGHFEVGEEVEFQLDLAELDAIVNGVAEVRRAEYRAPQLNKVLICFRKMRREDQALLVEWCERQGAKATVTLEQGGQRPLCDLVESKVPSATGRDLPPPPRLPQPPREPESGPGSRHSIFSLSNVARGEGIGRAAIRAVLRAAAGEPLPVAGAPSQGGSQPLVRLDLAARPPTIEACYDDDRAWRRDWDAWISQGLLFVACGAQRPALDDVLRVRLLHPDRRETCCEGRVVLLHDEGFGLALDVDPEDLRLRDLVDADPDPPMSVLPAPRHSHQPSSPSGRSFWARLFGKPVDKGSLAATIAALPDPLAPLQGLDARQRRRLDAILRDSGDDYLATCEQVTALLDRADWQWPELQARAGNAADSNSEAAAYIVLASVCRADAADLLLELGEDALVQLESGEGGCCKVCGQHAGPPIPALDFARGGLPPYHLGCRCKVVAVGG